MIFNFLNKQREYVAKIRWCLFVAVAIMLISFVILMGVLRLVLPYLTSYEKEIESQLQSVINHRVNVSRIDAGWHWFSPQLKLVNVNVFKNTNKTRLVRFDEVIFEFNVVKNLINFKFEPSVVTLKGTKLFLERSKQGVYSVQGVTLGKIEATEKTSVGNEGLLQLMSDKELRLQETTIEWVDQVHSSQKYVFNNLNMAIQVDENHHALKIETDVPKNLGKNIQLLAELDFNAGSWKSELYIDANEINVKPLLKYLDTPNYSLSSKLNTKLWLSFNDLQLKSVVGDFSAIDVDVVTSKRSTERKWSSEKISSVFQVIRSDGEWNVAVNDLNVKLNASQWNDVYFSFKYQEKNNSFDARVEYLELSDVSKLLSNLPLDEKWLEMVEAINPKGELRNTEVYISNWKKSRDWVLKTHFNNLGASVPGEDLRLDGVSGQINIGDNVVNLNLDSDNVDIRSKYFNKSLVFDKLNADIEIKKNKNSFVFYSDSIFGKIDGVNVSSRIKYEKSELDFLDFQVALDGADVHWFNRYLTGELLGKDTAAWLSYSLQEGQLTAADFMFYGAIKDFPFRENEGVIQSIVKVEKGVLKYQPDWPAIKNLSARFTLDNESIVIDQSSGYLNDSYIATAVTSMDLSGLPRVKIIGDVKTNADDVDKFFKETPLKQDYLDLIQFTGVHGQLKTHLNIDIPLDDSNDVNVSGNVVLNDNVLRVKNHGYSVKNVNGVVNFKNSSISATELLGEFNENKASAKLKTIKTKHGLKTILLANLKSDVTALMPTDLNLDKFSSEKADWKLVIGLNQSSVPSGELMSLNLTSNLAGVQLKLPPPFYKPGNKQADFQLDLNLFESSSSLLVHYDNKLDLSMRWDDDFQNIKSDARIMNGKVQDLKDGINVVAKLKTFDVNKWRKLAFSLLPKQKNNVDFTTAINLDFSIAQLKYVQYQLNNLDLKVGFDTDWSAYLSSDEASGHIVIPKYYNAGNPLVMDFKHLDLSKLLLVENQKEMNIENKVKTLSFSPENIPPLKIKADNFSYKNYKFNEMKLITSRTPYGMSVHALDLKGENLALKLKGNWFSRKNSAEHSNFRIEIESKDVGHMLSYYKFTDSIKDGMGRAVVDWQWAASPLDFDWKLVSGKMQIDIEDGRFVDIEPGVGRLLGMFSLSALPKRFLFNFSDTFTEGYEFNRFKSSANFSEGNLYTNNTQLTGHAADINFRGRIGLSNKDYDQLMSVIPRISSGVSGWIAVAQGAVIGLTAYVAQKLLGVDEAAKNQYHITGSWNDPVIKKIDNSTEVGIGNNDE